MATVKLTPDSLAGQHLASRRLVLDDGRLVLERLTQHDAGGATDRSDAVGRLGATHHAFDLADAHARVVVGASVSTAKTSSAGR